MKVVFVSGSFPEVRCGVGDYTARLSSELARQEGIDVSVVTTDAPLLRGETTDPVKVQKLNTDWNVGSLFKLMAMLRRLNPDLVHLQYPATGYGRALGIVLLPLVVRLFLRVPLVLTLHEWSERRLQGRLVGAFLAYTSSIVIMPDPVEAGQLRRRLPPFAPRVIAANQISNIPINAGVQHEEWRARFGGAEAELILSTFGLIHPRRQIEKIIEALAHLRQTGTAARLWIIGGEAQYDAEAASAYSQQLHGLVEALGLSEAVDWIGYVSPPEVSALLQTSDVVVMLYPKGASQRNTTLQAAIEHGAPVVTTEGPATSDRLRAQLRVYFLPSDAVQAERLASVILAAHQSGKASITGGYTTSALSEHTQLHLALYSRLLKHKQTHTGTAIC